MNKPCTSMRTTPLLAALAAAFALGACSRQDDGRSAGQKVDDTVARVEQKADQAQSEMNSAAADAKASAREAAADAKVAAADAGNKVASAVNDATITTTVNAELAKDGSLSATRIDVDTSQGHVALRGTAPSTQAKERATQIAASVKGVTSVDNLLTVEPKS